MKIAFYTLGCKLNQVETEAVASAFREEGYTLVPVDHLLDIAVINTCTVTSKSEQKARRMVRKISRDNPLAAVLVTGCYAEMERAEVIGLGPNVLPLSLKNKERLLDLPGFIKDVQASELKDRISAFFSEDPPQDNPFRFVPDEFTYHTRAFLKVQDGCDNICTYCRVRLARGPSRSLDSGLVISRLNELSSRGYREVVLTGVNLDSYYWDGCSLPSLLKRIVQETEGSRVRLSSLNPDAVTDELLEALVSDRICPHFHIAVQSGSDDVLKGMKRTYDHKKIISSVTNLRSVKNDPFIAMDIITGFPGETDENFRETFELLKHLEPSALHIFPFSPRPGTEAMNFFPRVPDGFVKERVRLLGGLSLENTKKYIQRWIGRPLEVIVEDASGSLQGISENYLRFPFLIPPPEGASLLTAAVTETEEGHFFS